MSNERAIGVIPARWGSTRLPGKSLVLIGGRPLVLRVWDAACRAGELDRVCVATDDERIRAVVEQAGGLAVMTRADHPSGTDRVAEAVAGFDAGLIVNIQGDEPFIDPGLIDRLVRTLRADPAADMATAATPIRDPRPLSEPSVVKVVWGQGHRALYFSRAPIPHVRDADVPGAGPLHWRHLGIYAYRRAFLDRLVAAPPCRLEQAEKLEQLRALDLGCRMIVLETEQAGIGVDTPADVTYAENVLQGRMQGDH